MNLDGFSDWLTRAGTSPHTQRAYLRLMRHFEEFLMESGRDAEAVMADEHERTFAARDWRQHLRHARRLSAASVNQALAALHTYCQFAGLSVPNVKREDLPNLAPRALDEAEQKRLLRAIERTESVRDKAIAYTLYYTGLRIAEVTGLDLPDVLVSDRRGKVIVRKGRPATGSAAASGGARGDASLAAGAARKVGAAEKRRCGRALLRLLPGHAPLHALRGQADG